MANEKGLKVLVADDSVVARHMFGPIAKRWPGGIELTEAECGESCLRHLAESSFDLAFLDVHMPGMTGLEALCHARQNGTSTFTVLMSSRPCKELVSIAQALNAYDFIAKPFEQKDIMAILLTYERIRRPMRALLVDDSATMRKLILRIIERSVFQIEVDEAGDGLDAVEKCRSTPYDMVILDMNMPGVDGPQTLARMRTRNPNVRVAITSSEGEEDVRRRFGNVPIQSFLKKPFHACDVDTAVRQLFGLVTPFEKVTADPTPRSTVLV